MDYVALDLRGQRLLDFPIIAMPNAEFPGQPKTVLFLTSLYDDVLRFAFS